MLALLFSATKERAIAQRNRHGEVSALPAALYPVCCDLSTDRPAQTGRDMLRIDEVGVATGAAPTKTRPAPDRLSCFTRHSLPRLILRERRVHVRFALHHPRARLGSRSPAGSPGHCQRRWHRMGAGQYVLIAGDQWVAGILP